MAVAHSSSAADLDTELSEGIDFRDLAFRACFQSDECEVNGVKVRAETRRSENAPWEPALIYWDPIDGLGVLGGGQDDEIDFNERILIQTPKPLAISKVWLTDLFSGEITHYRGLNPAVPRDVDYEAGRILFTADASDALEIELRGLQDLPETPFNELVDGAVFIEAGDLHYRLLIEDGSALLSFPLIDEDGERGQRVVKLNTIESGKLNLFSDGDELDYDLDDVFGEDEVIELFPIGEHNAKAMASIVNETDRLSNMSSAARVRRDVGDIENGEVAVQLLVVAETNEMIFYAPAGTSNDFSVAGLVIAK
jgi:hypothetical protein